MNQNFEEQVIPQEVMLYRVLAENDLLLRVNCKASIDKIIALVYEMLAKVAHSDDTESMGERFFEVCYLELIYDYAKFVQSLPEAGRTDDIPMLERGLARAAATLQWFQPQIEALSTAHPQLGGVQKLVYVIFSSALLYEIGSIEQERVIHLCNAQGHFIGRWDPLMGHMDSATHYKIRYRVGWNEELKTPLTHCLAKKLMPTVGLLWLSDSQASLSLWFSLLNGPVDAWLDYGFDFSLEQIDILMQEYLKNIQAVDKQVSDDTLLGEIFWDWLKRSMDDALLNVNHHGADVHVLEDGLLLDVDLIYDKFKKYFATDINKTVLMQQFNHMGIADISGDTMKVEKYVSAYPLESGVSGSVKNLFGDRSSSHNVQHGVIQGLMVNQAHALVSMRHYGTIAHVSNTNPVSWLSSFMSRFQQVALSAAISRNNELGM